MPDQVVFVLNNVELNGKADDPAAEWNVPIKASNQFVLSRMKNAKLWQRIGFEFAAEIPAKVKGMNPAKSITPYMWKMDETYQAQEDFGGTLVSGAEAKGLADDAPFK
jgi:hypothetical protein